MRKIQRWSICRYGACQFTLLDPSNRVLPTTTQDLPCKKYLHVTPYLHTREHCRISQASKFTCAQKTCRKQAPMNKVLALDDSADK
jgi:hypothetical protein